VARREERVRGYERARAREVLRLVPLVPWRLDRARGRADGVLCTDGELVQAVRRRFVGADAHRLELRQSHGRLSRRRPRAELAHRMPHPGRRLQPLSCLRRGAGIRAGRHQEPDRAAGTLRW
jgi:hypothetical protein